MKGFETRSGRQQHKNKHLKQPEYQEYRASNITGKDIKFTNGSEKSSPSPLSNAEMKIQQHHTSHDRTGFSFR